MNRSLSLLVGPKSWLPVSRLCAIAALVASSSILVVKAAPEIPNPCKLVTVAELEPIVGPLKGAPKSGGAGELSCEYTPASGPRWIRISLHDGELSYWKKRNGGSSPVLLPEFGSDSFVNPDFEGSADLYAKKGGFILDVSTPKGPKAVDMVKAIAKKALPRL